MHAVQGAWRHLRGGLASKRKDLLDLVDGRSTWKDWLRDENLPKYAAKAPHVDAKPIARTCEQNLGCTVPGTPATGLISGATIRGDRGEIRDKLETMRWWKTQTKNTLRHAKRIRGTRQYMKRTFYAHHLVAT